MKNLLIVTFLTFLLASCWGQSVDKNITSTGVETSTGAQNSLTGGIIIWDENGKDPVVASSWSVESSTIINSHIGTSWTTGSGKAEDQIVKDFEKEIDNLLNTIDKDGTTKK